MDKKKPTEYGATFSGKNKKVDKKKPPKGIKEILDSEEDKKNGNTETMKNDK